MACAVALWIWLCPFLTFSFIWLPSPNMLSKMRSGARTIFLWKYQSSLALNISFSAPPLSISKLIKDFRIRLMKGPPKTIKEGTHSDLWIQSQTETRRGRYHWTVLAWKCLLLIQEAWEGGLGRHRLEHKEPLNECLSPPALSISAQSSCRLPPGPR